ncbi:hypothetical protein [Roseibium aggregatum]|uniref:hypothetical protein n=1 Tax=Roseibium aggregatum TaxID=187304 RepID=UPI001E3D538F|nr:hypothetical protein [Roseibium aggregatum]UES39413.1 hypothetical protein GFC08_16990 [Roseibium aggregatum]
MENNVPEKQVIEELNQIQDHLMRKYGSAGVANEKLQQELKELGRKGGGYWDARKLLEGALIFNRNRSEDPERQKIINEILGGNSKVGPAVSGFGNSEEGRRRAREFLGLSKPGTKTNSEEPAMPEIPVPLAKPMPRGWFGTGLQNEANPFDLKRPDLKKQADMLDRSPAAARKLIVAAGRDPGLFLI